MSLKPLTHSLFTEHFGYAPALTIQAPGRVNLIGEHTDYNDGFVLPCAIDYQTVIACAKRDDRQIRVLAADYQHQQDQFSLDDPIVSHPDQRWSDYVRGVVKHLQRRNTDFGGADLVIAGNVPQGAGLSSSAALEVAVQQYNANQAMVLNTPLEQQPAIQQAAAQMRDAWLALQRTKVISPITGYVSRRSVQVGAQIAAGSPLMAVVPADHIWVDANFKETQIANMRIGQPATVVSDVYGDDVVYQGKVAGIDMGTGSAFSLLPAQNATGNWIKVVQRLPVRIELDAKQVADHPLRIGLSTLVTVDTANLDGRVLADVVRDKPLYQSDALALNLAPVNQLIADVIHANAG